MRSLINLIDNSLESYIKELESIKLQEIINYALFPGGKRFRPLLLLAILMDLNVDPKLGINQAIAIEMIHNYSLIHDDLPAMDNDEYRRGKLTVHKKFNQADAILAGDALLTDAFKYFVAGNISDSKKVEIVKIASQNAGGNGMVYGQILDMDESGKESLEFVKKIHYHKTRDLIHLAIYSGGIIANLDKQSLNELSFLADYFGIAFQIKDDLEDYLDNKSDLSNNKITYPSVIGIDESKKILEQYKNKSLNICEKLLGKKLLYEIILRIL